MSVLSRMLLWIEMRWLAWRSKRRRRKAMAKLVGSILDGGGR